MPAQEVVAMVPAKCDPANRLVSDVFAPGPRLQVQVAARPQRAAGRTPQRRGEHHHSANLHGRGRVDRQTLAEALALAAGMVAFTALSWMLAALMC